MEPVAAPQVAPPRLGLIVSAQKPTDTATARWQGGFSYQPEGCGIFARAEARCVIDEREVPFGPSPVEWEPFYAVTGYACRPLPGDDQRHTDLANRQLRAFKEFIVSAEFWTGTIADEQGYPNRPLASTLSDDLNGSNDLLSLTHGMACLEQYLTETLRGQQGMIHATSQTVTHWQGLGLLRREGVNLLTALDTLVVQGAGYDGSAPDGAPAGAVGGRGVWAYATDMVQYRENPAPEPAASAQERFRRTDNTLITYAGQLVSASWPMCAHGAVRLDVEVCGTAGS